VSDAKDAHLAWAKACGIKLETQNERKASYSTWRVCEGEIRRLKEALKKLSDYNERLEYDNDKMRNSNDDLQESLHGLNELLAEKDRLLRQAN